MNIMPIVVQLIVASGNVFFPPGIHYLFAGSKMHSNVWLLCVCILTLLFSSFCLLFCRGFGFVTFTDAASVDKVLAQQHHELDSKTVS